MAKREPGTWFPLQTSIEKIVTDRAQPMPENLDRVEHILAIDPGTKNLAAAYIHRTKRSQTVKTTKFEIPKFNTTYQTISYLELAIREWLFTFLKAERELDLIIKETIAHGTIGGVADAGRIQHMIESMADQLLVPYVDVNPTSMRAYLGSKSKSDTKLAVFKKFHAEFPSEDECDVFAIAMTGLALITGEYAPKKKK